MPMTFNQMRAALKILLSAEAPRVEHAQYTRDHTGRIVESPKIPGYEVERLMDSDDFKLGWQLCYEHFSDQIRWLCHAKDRDLARYNGKYKEKK